MADAFTIRGLTSMTKALEAVSRNFPDAAAQALFADVEVEVATPAKRRVPRDKGILRNTIHVNPPERRGKWIEVRIVAGGPSSPSALALHEHPDNRKYSPPSWTGPLTYTVAGTGSKFIEGPMMEAIPGMTDRIAADINLNGMER